VPGKRDGYITRSLVLLVVGVLVRLLLMTRLRPLLVDPSYVEAARNILQLNFRALGDRTPVYPLLIALCGLNPWAVWVAQSILGLAASWMILDMAFVVTRRGSAALVIALACSLIRDVLLYEPAIASEALAGFLLVASFWLITRGAGTAKDKVWYPLGVGLTAALAGLDRPLLLSLIPVYYFFVVPIWPPANILRLDVHKKSFLFAVPVITLVFGWCGFNYFNNGFFTPTTRAGQQLMDQVTPYVELAPDKFAVLRDVWVKNRPHFHDVQEDMFNESLPEIQRRTGKSRIEVSRELTHLALYLQIHHPLLCLRRAEDGWMQFWGAPNSEDLPWAPDFRMGLTGFISPMLDFLTRQVVAVFLVLALLSFPCALFRLRVFTKSEYFVFTLTLWASIFAAFTEFGDNRRFSVPFLPLMFYVVLTWGWGRINSLASGENHQLALPSNVGSISSIGTGPPSHAPKPNP
jgi:hypothetical protein